ncbi:DNA methyltransferase [Peribacillus frigoritolerans]
MRFNSCQKPIAVLEKIIAIHTNTNNDETELDCCMGSGSTGQAPIKLKRTLLVSNWIILLPPSN